MKHVLKVVLATTLLFLILPSLGFAQKIKILTGDFAFLRDQRILNIAFDYRDVTFYNEMMSEQTYIKNRMEEIGSNKGEAEAEVWRKDWDDSKSTTFVNKFLASMNKNLSIVSSTDNKEAKYTLLVSTTWIYPGWFAGVMKQKAKVSTVLTFIESSNPGKILLKIESREAPGDVGFVGVQNNNDRIAEGYAKTAKTLAALIQKNM
ncbi:hypothetical protein [Sphingobacterium sp. LRF_L2]|uniref:hypothetical protein n=1 Tax=Sphingobacterium sp. LRF_L2 TaxID=3369421 RepID=UPI003F6052BA